MILGVCLLLVLILSKLNAEGDGLEYGNETFELILLLFVHFKEHIHAVWDPVLVQYLLHLID